MIDPNFPVISYSKDVEVHERDFMRMNQDFSFGFTENLLVEVGRVPKKALHFDAESILKAYENIKPLARQFGIELPRPQLAGFCYPHVASLGAKIVFPEDSEPKPFPIIHSLEEIKQLEEPKDYLKAELIQERLKVLRELKKRFPQAPNSIGHLLEGPITTAVLVMGPGFLTLPYDNPELAHHLLNFCTRSALNYAHAITEYFRESIQPGPKGFPDDFAGMFPPDIFKEFVVPYWEEIFQGLTATKRSLHSELLRVEHLPFLAQLKIGHFDPSADQYLTPELLARYCPCKFQCSIQDWHVRDLSAEELEAMYRKIAEYKPSLISFYMDRMEDESKIQHLLGVARKMKGN